MPDAITRSNDAARKRAQESGRDTYPHTVTDSWPACVQCATPIRDRGDRLGRRRCACPDVVWWCDSTGWRRSPEATP